MGDIFGWGVVATFSAAYFAQIWHTVRSRSTEDVSPLMWKLTGLGSFVLYCYGVSLLQVQLVILGAVGIFSSIYMLVLISMYVNPIKEEVNKVIRTVIKELKKRKDR